MSDAFRIADASACGLRARNEAADSLSPKGRFVVECRAADGSLRWVDEFPNVVTNAGRDDVLDKYLRGSGYTASWFVGLKGAGAPAAADTLASKAWSEITAYSNATRPGYTAGVPASQSASNTASPATFNINGTATVAGAFLAANSTKGGTTGILFCVADFASSRNVVNGDTLTVTYTVNA